MQGGARTAKVDSLCTQSLFTLAPKPQGELSQRSLRASRGKHYHSRGTEALVSGPAVTSAHINNTFSQDLSSLIQLLIPVPGK